MPSLTSMVDVVECDDEESELLGDGGNSLKLIVKLVSSGVSNTDPASLIKESYRVLESGSSASFSIGRSSRNSGIPNSPDSC